MQKTLSWFLRFTAFIAVTSALTVTVIYVYHLFWLAPAAAAPQALTDIEAVTVKHYFSLLKHRLAIQELAGLDPASPDFYREREGAVAVLTASREESLQTLDNNLPNSPPSLDHDIIKPLTALRSRHKEVLTKQKAATDSTAEIEKITRELSAYQPEYDLRDDPATQSQPLINKLAKANKAINTLIQEMNKISSHSAETDKLISLLKLTVSEQPQDNANLAQTRDNFIQRINQEIKPAILAANLAPLKNDTTLPLMAEETNIIDDYRYLLDSIDAKQAEIYRKNQK